MPWYVGHTKPRQEDRVSSHLTELGLEVFVPKIPVRRRRRGQVTSGREPLFPGYLFIAADLTPHVWNAIRWAPGVKAILGCDGVPSRVADEPIALIKQRVGADGVIQLKPAFAPGDLVRIAEGPFAGLVGILERRASRAGRVQVLLDMLRGATLEIEDVDLELAS